MNILCKYCNKLKLEIDFTPSQIKRNYPKCKECIKEYDKQYHIENREKIKEYDKQYKIKHKEEIKERDKQYRSEHKEEIKENKKQYNAEHKEEIKEQRKQYRTEHKEELKEYKKQWYVENKEEIKEHRKQYNIENKENIKEYKKQYEKDRRKTDPVFKLRDNVSKSIHKALHKNSSSKNGQSILKYLPYTIEELKNYLESLFEPWMSWENHGVYSSKTWNENDQSTWVWHLDHVMPQESLPYISMKDDNFKICWALENLRPYNAKKNIEEGNNRLQEEIAKIKSDIKERLENIIFLNTKQKEK